MIPVYLLLSDKFSNKIPADSVVLTSAHTNLELKFADLGLQLDEMIYLSKKTVDLVFVVKGNEELKLHRLVDSNIIYFLGRKAYGSFCCKPEIISTLSSMYKYDISILKEHNKFYPDYFGEHLDTIKTHTNKMLHLIDRAGITISVG